MRQNKRLSRAVNYPPSACSVPAAFRRSISLGTEPSLDLPLAAYVNAAIEYNNARQEEDIDWRTPLWDFVRLMKGYPSIRGMDAAGALRVVEIRLQDLGKTWTGDLPCSTVEDARTEFLDAWDKVRFLPGYGPVEYAWDRASSNVIVTERSKRAPDLYAEYNRFVSFAVFLQKAVGDRPILLPCHKLASRFEVTAMTISRWRDWAIKDGVVKVVAGHRYNPKGSGEATKFRVNVIDYPDALGWLADTDRAIKEAKEEAEGE